MTTKRKVKPFLRPKTESLKVLITKLCRLTNQLRNTVLPKNIIIMNINTTNNKSINSSNTTVISRYFESQINIDRAGE